MSEMSRLERRYRRLLAWYPARHRRTYGEEMIGVLLASAPDGQQHPRLAGGRARFHDFAWRVPRIRRALQRARSRSLCHPADAPEIRRIGASVLAAILQTIAPKQ